MTAATIQGMKNALSKLQQSTDQGRVIERLDPAVSFQELDEQMGLTTIKDMGQRPFAPTQTTPKCGSTQ
jgi:hypothetical protein